MLTQQRWLPDLKPAPLDEIVQPLSLGERQSVRIPSSVLNNLGKAAAQPFVENPEISLISRPSISSKAPLSKPNPNMTNNPEQGTH